MRRSRERWLSEGVFERYWTKPSKKKNQPGTNNPARESMSKIGPCTLTIEPHVFEIVLYAVRENRPLTSTAPPPQNSQRPILQFGPPKPFALQHTLYPPPAAHPTSTHLPRQQQHGLSRNPYHSLPPPLQPGPPRIHPAPPTTDHVPEAAPAQSPKSGPDPVIQMLATKAAADPELKALMKVVASGKASTVQLKVFQGHIDELTAVIQARERERKLHAPSPASTAADASPSLPQASGSSMTSSATRGTGSQTQPTRVTMPTTYDALATTVKPEMSSCSPPVAARKMALPKSKASALKSHSEISEVVFEFSAGSGDRFRFPKFSILEYLSGGTQVIASFLVVRKGSSSQSGAYDADLDYYQPVTMRLNAHDRAFLEPLSRIVASPSEARRYMDDIMDHMTRAEYVHLAMRLPRDAADAEANHDKLEEPQDHEDSMSALYAPPGSTGPPKQKLVRTAVSRRAGHISPRMTLTPGQSLVSDRSSTEPWASPIPVVDAAVARPKKGRVADPNKSCHICHTSTTSLWRKADIDGESVTGTFLLSSRASADRAISLQRVRHQVEDQPRADAGSRAWPPPKEGQGKPEIFFQIIGQPNPSV